MAAVGMNNVVEDDGMSGIDREDPLARLVHILNRDELLEFLQVGSH